MNDLLAGELDADDAGLNQRQRLLIAQHLEERLDPHVFRVDEKTLVMTQKNQRGVQVAYTLLEYGGCAGPGKTHHEQVFVEAAVFS